VGHDGVLSIEVSDDGDGGAGRDDGTGLLGISDRVAAVGGTLRVHSPPGQGTRLEMELPCVSS
jgi:signal transduction histidine kinase